jgi:hypothetical protein
MADKTTQNSPGTKQRERSPNYPSIGLSKALELAKTFWEHDRRQSVLVSRAITDLGFGAKSSTGPLAISAMRKYGLFDAEGSGHTRKVKLTELAVTLLNPSAPNRDQLIKQAALLPSIHAKLWQKFGADGASEGAIHDYLVFELHFTEPAGKALIDQYLDTIAFAKLLDSDKITQQNDDEILPNSAAELAKPPYRSLANAFSQSSPPMTSNLRYLPIPLDIGDAPIPVGMSDSDFDLLLDTLKLWKKKIVRSEYPKQAIWRNKDHDKPVTIIGYAGEKEGVKYYQSSTGTGIPESELEFDAAV